jgi:subtilisin family serine protease
MPRYVIANRLARSESETPGKSARAYSVLHEKFGPVVGAGFQTDPSRIQILEGAAGEFQARRAELGDDVLVEPELARLPAVAHSVVTLPQPQSPLPSGLGASIELDLVSDRAPVDDALVLLYLQSTRGAPPTSSVATSASGHAVLPFDPSMWFPVAVAVAPRAAAWSFMTRVTSQRLRFDLPALPRNGPLAWWHRLLGIDRYDPARGEGIRVGVVDTGIGPHPYLEHAKRAGSFLDGTHDTSADATNAVSDHGTHVAGIIGARPTDLQDFGGIAPGADLVIARVYPGGGPPGMESGPTSNANIAQAILTLARDEQCDLINLSSSGPMRSELEINRINAALELGTLVICSVGNSGGPVMFPAADPSAIGVTALGLFNTTPPGVLDSMSLPPTPDRYAPGGIFSPLFVSLGLEVKCAGPGVGIISTVPPFGPNAAPYVAMSGTSMAAPAVTGALAALLSRDAVYKSLPRNGERSRRAGAILARSLRSLGLIIPYQGFGLASVGPQ